MVTWGDLFDRAGTRATTAEVRETLSARREARAGGAAGGETDVNRESRPTDGPDGNATDPGADGPDPTRVVADADVLAADLLVGDPARAALDGIREHAWMVLVASDPLLDDAETVLASLSDPALAADWRERVERERVRVVHPPGDHPGLASAYRGGAAHLLTFDEDLASARTGLSIQPYAGLSVRHPDAFATVFDPAGLYEATRDGDYPGPDRDPRS